MFFLFPIKLYALLGRQNERKKIFINKTTDT